MSTALRYTLFDTAVGACALVWGDAGLRGVRLPESTPAATRDHLLRRWPTAEETVPDAPREAAVRAIRALLQGARDDDLQSIALDLQGIAPFPKRVYTLARRIGPGQVRSYGEIAAELGGPELARAVGQALGANPWPIVVPCHRVLAAATRSGGFSAPGGVATKLKLLEIERARFGGTPGLFDEPGP